MRSTKGGVNSEANIANLTIIELAYVCVCSRFPPRRLAPRVPHFHLLIYDSTSETKRLYFFEIPRISRVLIGFYGKSYVRYVKR